MSEILQKLLVHVGPKGIQAISSQIGASDEQTANALSGILPTLLGAMANNTKTPEGAQGLLGALEEDHDGSILDDVSGFVGSFSSGPGLGILSHVLGNNQSAVEQGLSAKTGLSGSQIASLLQIAAPLVLGYLGLEKRKASIGGFDIGTITQLLGGMTQQTDRSTGIDLGDILNMFGGMTSSEPARNEPPAPDIGSLLGKLFG